MISGLMASIGISDEDRAVEWYGELFGRGPDARPMPGLTEWRLADNFGIQLWTDAQRAGGSTIVLDVTDLDAVGQRLQSAGIEHGEPSAGGGRRILPVADPDGNQVVFFGE